jgi:type II secretory pathway pseudopilin PulG
MKLRGQHGYAMAVLLVTLSVMAILLSVAMPVWKHASQREKEAELVFRGQQYVHAIGLFQRKHGPGVLPPAVDVLVNERFLRKKFKDPITNGDFQVLLQGAQAQAAPGTGVPGSSTPGRTTAPAPGTSQGRGVGSPTPGTGPQSTIMPGGGRGAGMIGVASKSTATSIRMYNGRTHYNEWAFVFTPTVQAPGGVPTPGQPGRQGGPGTTTGRPGGPGTGPASPFMPGSPFGPGGPGRGTQPNPRPGGGRGRGPGGQ